MPDVFDVNKAAQTIANEVVPALGKAIQDALTASNTDVHGVLDRLNGTKIVLTVEIPPRA